MSDISLSAPFEAYTGKEAYIFVSYAHIDGLTVFPELINLNKLGFRIWYDEGIEPGNEWPEEIAKALNSAAFFLVFISPAAVNSRNVRNEINFALTNNKPFLAIHLEETPLPLGLGLQMGSLQAILKYNMPWETFLKKIEKTLPVNLRETKIIIDPPIVITTLDKLKSEFYFIIEKEPPYYVKFREEELPIVFQPFTSQNNKANIWFLQAEKMFYTLKVEEATRFYKRTIEEDSKFIEAYLKLALISWLHPNISKDDDAIHYCQTGFELNNKHIIGSLLIYLYLNKNTDEAQSVLDNLIKSDTIENKNQLAGLFLLQSRLYNKLNNDDQEFENATKANQISPLFGPALRHLARIYVRKKETGKAEILLNNAFQEYSKYIYCRNWLDTRDLLISMHGQAGRNEMLVKLLNESYSVQRLLNDEEAIPSVSSNISFEGEIDGIETKGYLINGNGFKIHQAILQDGTVTGNKETYEFNPNHSAEICIFYDLRFGGTVVKIKSISYLIKIVQNNNTACLIQTDNGFKLSGVKDGFPNLWFMPADSAIKPMNLSLTESFNLKRI